MKYAIIENERLALDLMKAIMKRVRPQWELAFTAANVSETINFFKTMPEVDICFMDIELNDGDCFSIFEEIELNIPIIFTTAYDEFMLKAFKVNSIDYLLKPILETDVEQAVLKYERYYAQREHSNTDIYRKLKELADTNRNRPSLKRVLTVSGDRYNFVSSDNIAWLVSEDKYVYVVDLNGNRRMTTFATLGEAGDLLNQDSFFVLRRNLICSTAAIKSVCRYFKGRLKVTLHAGADEIEVVVSADKRQTFLNWLGGINGM